MRSVEVQQFGDEGTGTISIVYGIRIVPSAPVTPVRSIPIAWVVPPPFGASVVRKVVSALYVTHLQTEVGVLAIVCTDITAVVHIGNVCAEDFLCTFVFPIFGVFTVADNKDAIR